MTDTKSFKVIIGFEDGVMSTCGAVEYEGAVWLVPKWLPYREQGYAKPERMIRLDQFRFQKFDPPATGPGLFEGADFAVNDPLPKRLFVGALSPKLKRTYVVRQHPDIRFRVGGTVS